MSYLAGREVRGEAGSKVNNLEAFLSGVNLAKTRWRSPIVGSPNSALRRRSWT